MPDLPQDPRQLARDILAGRISIEDLAREQARRRGQVPGSPPPPPRPAPPAQPTLRRPAPSRPQQRPVARPPQQPQRPVFTPPPKQPVTIRQSTPQAPRAPAAPQTAESAYSTPDTVAQTKATKDKRTSGIKSLLNTRQSARNAIILAELLNKPLSMRDGV